MNHYIQEELNGLTTFIKRNYNRNNYNSDSPVALEADIVWDAARFWANVLYKGEFRTLSLNLAGFQNFKTSYENSNNITIDENQLFETNWLRNVLGFIKIPTAISSACINFESIKLYKNELIFLLHFQGQSMADTNLYDKGDIEAARLEYENKNHINLSDEGLYGRDRRWAGIKADNKIQLSNMDAYFKVYLDHWDKFEFISAYKNERIENRKKDFVIDGDGFEALHGTYSNLFDQMPSIEALLEDNILNKEGEHYSINFYRNKAEYWGTLREKISGFLWELYKRDKTIITDAERIKKWLNVVENWENLGDPLKYVTASSRSAFLEAAYELVISDPDLDGIDNELEKILLDNRWKGSVYVPGKEILKKLDVSDLFELMQSFIHFENNADTTYLYDQHSRYFIGLLIQLLVKYDVVTQYTFDENGTNAQLNFHKRVKELIRNGLSKPYLMWETTRFILLERPEIITYLILESDLASLSFTLIDEIIFPDKEKDYLNMETWKLATSLLLKMFNTNQPNIPVNSKIIFQVYRQLNQKKYTLPYSRNIRANSDDFQKVKSQKEEDVLRLIENAPLRYVYDKPVEKYMIPEIFDELASSFTGFPFSSVNQFGYINFPMMQWDGMFWLMKTSTYYKYGEQLKFNPIDISELTKSFINAYLGLMELEEVRKFDHKENKEIDGLPHWSERIERLGILDWLYPIYLIHINGKLSHFLAPRFDVEVTDDLYNEKNKLAASKIRTHIGVLIQVLKKLVLPVIPYGLTKSSLDEIKNRIEMQITDYIKIHNVNEPTSGKIDLFDFHNERQLINPTDKEALLPQIARAINWFSNKDLIIDAIIQSGDLNKILVIADLIISEGIRKKLLNQIKKADLITYLENLHWIPEIQNAMINISGHPELLGQLEEIIGYWEKHVVTRKNRAEMQYVSQLYRAKLLVAYFKNDEKTLDNVELPPPPMVNNPHELSYSDYKQFYRGLIRIKEKPESAAEIFDQLHKKFQSVVSFTLNRLVARFHIAEKQNSTDDLNRALEEWNIAENQMSAADIEAHEPKISAMKMLILNKLNRDEELDKVFDNLEVPLRMLPDVLPVKIDSLIKRNRRDEAWILIAGAEKYHQFGEADEANFIKEIKDTISGGDTVEELKILYNRIYRSAPKKLILIFPENLNGKTDLKEFITKEFVSAADKMLDKIESIAEIKDENKYNDIIELALDAKIYPWQWRIGAQDRGAFSDGEGKQPGERDLPVLDPDNKIIMVGEAFIYRGATKAKDHLEKIFNYYHQRSAFLILVYDTGIEGDDFDKKWVHYKTKIVPKAKFKDAYKLLHPVSDLTVEFGMENSAIKVGQSLHASDTIIYHVFVNINYKLN